MKQIVSALLIGALTLGTAPVFAQKPSSKKGKITNYVRSAGSALGLGGLFHAKTAAGDPTSLESAKSSLMSTGDPTSTTIPLGNVNATGIMTNVNNGTTSAPSGVSDTIAQNLHIVAQKAGAATDPLTNFVQAVNSPEGMLAGVIGASALTMSYLLTKLYQNHKLTKKVTTY